MSECKSIFNDQLLRILRRPTFFLRTSVLFVLSNTDVHLSVISLSSHFTIKE